MIQQNQQNDLTRTDRQAEPAELGERGARRQQRTYPPPADIFERRDEVVILADMPGVEQSGVEVTVDRGVLTVRGATRQKAPEGFSPVYLEFEPADFERSFTLSDAVDSGQVTATIANGVLRVVLPKHERARPRKIQVQSG
jgi:HSP20 family protein